MSTNTDETETQTTDAETQVSANIQAAAQDLGSTVRTHFFHGSFGGGSGGGSQGGGLGGSVAGTRTAVLDTGACGRITVEVESQPSGGGGLSGVAGWSTLTIRTDFRGMGPIGGGRGYTETVTESDADIVATSIQDLQDASRTAEEGDTIFVPSGEVIEDDPDDTGGETETQTQIQTQSLEITTQSNHTDNGALDETHLNAGGRTISFSQDEITVASDRGHQGNPGALIERSRSGSSSDSPLFRMTGESARVSGFRLRGPHTGSGEFDPGNSEPASTGVHLDGNGCEVDNCDIAGFTTAGIKVNKVLTAAIHHNFIHDHGMRGGGSAVYLDQPEQSALLAGSCSPGGNAAAAGSGGASGQSTAITTSPETQTQTQPQPALMADGGGGSDGGTVTSTQSIVTFNDYDEVQHALRSTGEGASFIFKRSRVGPEMFNTGVFVESPGGHQVQVSQVTFEASAGAGESCVRINGVPALESEIVRTWFHMRNRQLAVRQTEDGSVVGDAGHGGFDQVSLEENHFGSGRPSSRVIGAQRFL